MDDGGDFKKARGVLLTYSIFLLAMWFFKAKLTQFNLLGVSLTLEHHKDSIWLILAILNVYFWFRFFQRIPRLGLYFDEPMHDLYDKALVWLALRTKRGALRRFAREHFALKHDPSEKMKIVWYGGIATGRGALEEEERQYGDVGELHRVVREFRTKMNLHVNYVYTSKGEWVPFNATADYGEYAPGIVLTWTAKTFAIIKGSFVTPWFTDHIAPLIVGAISTTIALWKWVEINFLSVAV